jgi:hypothetical protein
MVHDMEKGSLQKSQNNTCRARVNVRATIHHHPMQKPMTESLTRAVADRVAIERWEGEGGRIFALEDPLAARRRDRSGSDSENETTLGIRS